VAAEAGFGEIGETCSVIPHVLHNRVMPHLLSEAPDDPLS